MDGRIIVLKERIIRNLSYEWSVNEMACSIGISESYLQKLFKSEVKVSPYQYVLKLRLEKAKQLVESRMFPTIKEICYEIGISDISHFTRSFKKEYSLSPTKYREKYWKKYEEDIQNK